MAKISIVGAGPGSPDYVTPAANKAVQQAQVVIGAKRSLNLFIEVITGETMVLTGQNLNEAIKFAVESAEKGKKVVLLSTGDPGFSGLLHTVLESGFVKADKISVVPGISSVQACAAILGMNWDSACLFTFHEGTVTSQNKDHLLSCVKNGKTVMLLPDQRAFSPGEIASFLLKERVDGETRVFVCENLTLPEQKVTSSTLAQVSGQAFGSLCVMVIKPDYKIR